ncbi:putative 4-hydroxy-2-oxoglutarate aldolase [Colletotrichum orbiculare MAFF 240422]|uniref:4-hydroxy-2-oxoglutarate aldolase n=1 Tax=Colletotrichum orbiculare (strain 104-T / ATCC 96160 / CBS 514.97 / LARS 414 / MAFF 240422) TaxID=1213857 RepID=A0A484FMZ9_COLOR|nr:putative 4-hydroxy-2-oxoglutarate aldolase [Colletotrichum orbiculare MAFF 240422]
MQQKWKGLPDGPHLDRMSPYRLMNARRRVRGAAKGVQVLYVYKVLILHSIELDGAIFGAVDALEEKTPRGMDSDSLYLQVSLRSVGDQRYFADNWRLDLIPSSYITGHLQHPPHTKTSLQRPIAIRNHPVMSPSANGNSTHQNGNGTGPSPSRPALTPGLYVPTVAFFRPDDSVDTETTASHAVRLAKSGVAGIVTHGSNGEAVHLDHDERKLINQTTRAALTSAGFARLPLVVGCGAQSTRETVRLCREAAASGGEYALVLPPAYYGGLLSAEHVVRHFRDVADASPVPLLVYNYPGACSGLDLSSDTVVALAAHPNIVGVKLTCGNTGKLARIAAATASRKVGGGGGDSGVPFRTFGGSVDFTLQTLVVGGHGVIGGTGNIAPLACARLMRLWEEGKLAEARELQAVVARGDWAAIQGGFVSVKAALQEYFGYGGQPRKPCALLEGEALAKQVDGFSELVEVERSLQQEV